MQLPISIKMRLQHQHESLLDLIDGLTDEQLRRPIIAGKWSVFENIVHLQTYQHTFITRVNKVLEERNPVFARYTAEADPMFLDNCGLPTKRITEDLFNTRKEIRSRILSLKETELARTGQHPAFGQLTLLQWLHFFLLHEAHHLFTIFKLAAELRTAKR